MFAVMRAAGVVLVALALAACDNSTTTVPSSLATPAAAQAAASAAAATTAPTAAASANADQALIALLRGRTASYKVTYEYARTGDPDKSTLVQYFKAPYFRQDISVNAGGRIATFSTIVRPEGMYTCGTLIGPAPGCFSFPGAPGSLLLLLCEGLDGDDFFAEADSKEEVVEAAKRAQAAQDDECYCDPGDEACPMRSVSRATLGALTGPQAPPVASQDLTGWNLVPTTTRSVAGQTARCLTFSGAQAAGAEMIGCYTAGGIPLYLSSKSGGTEVVMTATSFSPNVTVSDFDPPYPVRQLRGVGET